MVYASADTQSLLAFMIMIFALGVLFPAWKYFLQHTKVLIKGPWEIPTTKSMQLDYKVADSTR